MDARQDEMSKCMTTAREHLALAVNNHRGNDSARAQSHALTAIAAALVGCLAMQQPETVAASVPPAPAGPKLAPEEPDDGPPLRLHTGPLEPEMKGYDREYGMELIADDRGS